MTSTMALEIQSHRVSLSVSQGTHTSVIRGQAKRGRIRAFSKKSRKRLLDMMASFNLSKALQNSPIVFITLTYGQQWPDCETAKRHLKAFLMRLRRFDANISGIWRVETQARGAWHFHLILFDCPYIPKAALARIWLEIIGDEYADNSREKPRAPFTRIESIRNPKKAFGYLSKYVAKNEQPLTRGLNSVPYQHALQWEGRHWGILSRENLPFGDLTSLEIELDPVMERAFYQFRRLLAHEFARANNGQRLSGATIYAWQSSDQWYRAFLYCIDQSIKEQRFLNHDKNTTRNTI